MDVGDGESALPAHQLVLAMHSPRLREMFARAKSAMDTHLGSTEPSLHDAPFAKILHEDEHCVVVLPGTGSSAPRLAVRFKECDSATVGTVLMFMYGGSAVLHQANVHRVTALAAYLQ